MSELTSHLPFSLPGSPATVYAALTDADALRAWLAEHVEIDLRVGGPYRFWGRHSYDTTTSAAATQTITALELDKVLAFTWHLHGRDSDVRIALAADESENNPGGTRLEVTHHFSDSPVIGRARELVDDLWRIHCGNLQAYLQGGSGISLPDFADPDPKVRVSIVIDAPVERVFASFLDPTILNRWIASAAEVEPFAGGRYVYGWNYKVGERDVQGGPTRILELVENEKLVTDWPDWRGDPEVPIQRVTWLFERVSPAQTRVSLVHEGFIRAVDISDYPFGWGHFLGQLKSVFDSA